MLSKLKSGILLLFLCMPATAGTFQTPLNAAEKALAMALVSDAVQEAEPSNSVTRRLPIELASLEWLSINVKKIKQKDEFTQAPRQADILLYDYRIQKSIFAVVNLQTQQLLDIRLLATHHLPLNSRERKAALMLVRKDKQISAQLAAELSDLGERSSMELKELHAKVAIFDPQNAASASAQVCLQQRCAHITFTTPSRLSLTHEPIVVLATGEVIGALGNYP